MSDELGEREQYEKIEAEELEETPWARLWEAIARARVDRWDDYTKADQTFLKALRIALDEYGQAVDPEGFDEHGKAREFLEKASEILMKEGYPRIAEFARDATIVTIELEDGVQMADRDVPVRIPDDLVDEVGEILEEGGYMSLGEFVRDAARRRLEALEKEAEV